MLAVEKREERSLDKLIFNAGLISVIVKQQPARLVLLKPRAMATIVHSLSLWGSI